MIHIIFLLLLIRPFLNQRRHGSYRIKGPRIPPPMTSPFPASRSSPGAVQASVIRSPATDVTRRSLTAAGGKASVSLPGMSITCRRTEGDVVVYRNSVGSVF